ncbi:hypothetical protein SDRG_07495 [Saprolegnia diclina VS20]|uniref:Uncharacterized protein n=1 Tax=Saprolegnia diclina (strain VS20) TaxID=1156394 RepID=T0QBI3_SAPDV|nr:hypothetical protein SDRG_07495 [Saprolegnia diclina VS20]EQC35269.1 hypothetical protein SDRG_07495 [Saprolegnia diclina VS20]|eukprot:XP_008611553.1 hypothetical protein SDRG_07495 [Saprolegnia diclina VS20]
MLATVVGHGLFPLGLLLLTVLLLPPCFLSGRIDAFIEALLYAFEFAGLSLVLWVLCMGIFFLASTSRHHRPCLLMHAALVQAYRGDCIALDDDATQSLKWIAQRNFWMGVSTAMTYLAVLFVLYLKKQLVDMTCRR